MEKHGWILCLIPTKSYFSHDDMYMYIYSLVPVADLEGARGPWPCKNKSQKRWPPHRFHVSRLPLIQSLDPLLSSDSLVLKIIMDVIIIKTLSITKLPTLPSSCADINIKSRVILELNVFFQLTTIQWRIHDFTRYTNSREGYTNL